jgi:hypothetical protein
MSKLEFTGKVIAVLDKRSGTSKAGNAWVTQEYVIETSDQYPKKCCFSLFGEEKIAACNIKIGETITAHIDIDARQWESKWFNSISAWKIERASDAAARAQESPQQAPSDIPQPGQQGDDLPF